MAKAITRHTIRFIWGGLTMGVNVLQELSAEQARFREEIIEDRFKYKNHVLDLSQPINEPKFLFNIGNPLAELI